ncbi:phosphotransferase [Akkermansiaceae bacterium]|nr:phosphotransferase [Akkermansiaceae bacterium]MDB4781624.1 phosphotransferase [Akkermansiaceae bacterium]
MNFSSWKGDLSEEIAKLQEVALGEHSIRLVALNSRIALGLPKKRDLADGVLKLYRPMKFRARVMAWCLRAGIFFGLHQFLGKSFKGSGAPAVSWLKNSESIGFLGCNPSHGIRCVFLDRNRDGVNRVTKVAIGAGHNSLENEGEQLAILSGKFEGIPKLGGTEKGTDWTALWTKHYAVPGPRAMEAAVVVPLLEGWLGSTSVRLGEVELLIPVLEEASPDLAKVIRKQVVRRALVHGDFTPWNLRWDGDQLMAIDWEWGCEEGVSGLDLGHGLVMEGHLVGKLSGVELVDSVLKKAECREIDKYLRESGWTNLEVWLSLVFLQSGITVGCDFQKELEVLVSKLKSQNII